jgi:hypothetical protein
MGIYRKRASAPEDRLRQARPLTTIFAITVVGIIGFLNWDLLVYGQGAARFLWPALTLGTYVLGMFLARSFAIWQLRKVGQSFRIEVTDSGVTRRLDGVPDIFIAFNEIDYLHFTRRGGMILEAIAGKNGRLVIPRDIEGFDQCRGELASHGVIERLNWKFPEETIWFADALYIVVYITVWLVRDQVIAALCGCGVILYSTATFWRTGRNRNVTQVVKYLRWGMLLLALPALFKILSVWHRV